MIVLALLLTISGPVLYDVGLGVPFLRSSGTLLFVPMVAGAALGVMMARRRRGWIRHSIAGIQVLLLVAAGWLFFFWARLPETPNFPSAPEIPDVVVTDAETGEPVGLREAASRGPLYLVFFRGSW